MTTILSLAARDFIVVGCDSLATQSTHLLNPQRIQKMYFNSDGSQKTDAQGKPLLTIDQLWGSSLSYPVNQLPSVTKLFDLGPAKKAALLFAGASRIGEISVKNLVESFKASREFKNYKSYTLEGLATRFQTFILQKYQDQYPNEWERPAMEILLSGYSTNHLEPEVFKLWFSYNFTTNVFDKSISPEVPRGQHNLVFGGQYDVIERVVQGVDFESYLSLRNTCFDILRNYRQSVLAAVGNAIDSSKIPEIDSSNAAFDLFSRNFGGVQRIFTDVGSLSEQAGIDFVTFLIHTMIKSQEFSTSIPTVGGDIHIGLITSADGFRWISKEEYKVQDHATPKFHHASRS
jgi:hypothetical protein